MGIFTKQKYEAIEAGELRHRITILKETDITQDETTNEVSSKWKAFLMLWAKIEPLTGRETQYSSTSSTITAIVSHRVTIRWRNNVDAKMRVQFQGRVFAITAVLNPEEQRRKLILLCTEQPGVAL